LKKNSLPNGTKEKVKKTKQPSSKHAHKECQHNVGDLTMAKCNRFPSVIYDASQK
jgi:hypothetical protein